MLDCSKIKLVIWDLDETFWSGTLSDNNVKIVDENVELVRNMIDAGVMCSICSKNDENEVKKVMMELGIWDLFVFKSINWTSKGDRVKQIIDEMNLRQPNVLFIDDNNSNLGEVKQICPDMMVEHVDTILHLRDYFKKADKKDLLHDRLNQYKVLEKKKEFKAKLGSNIEFLIQSNIEVEIAEDCENHFERLHDLILRSNQLNFTKVRSTKEELKNLFEDKTYKCGYVKVKDSFGDYGIVGFYAIKNNELVHFVFSCRTLNMGIEQYVYNKLGNPKVIVVGDVSSNLNSKFPYWINNKLSSQKKGSKAKINNSMLIKGPCDMSQMFAYINEDKRTITEFVYVNDNGVSIEQGNHTVHIKESLTLDDETKIRLINNLPFGDKGMFSTRMFDSSISTVVYSLFTDPNLGLYEEKESGALVAFGEYTNDLTNDTIWNKLIKKELFVANCEFNNEQLKYIKNNFKFQGRLSPEEILENLKFIHSNLNKDNQLILILGSETPYLANVQEAYADRHEFNFKLNNLVKEWIKTTNNVNIIDVNEFISGQDSFTNNINHFNKEIYYKMSQKLIELVNRNSNVMIKNRTFFNRLKINIRDFVKRVKNKIKKVFVGNRRNHD